MCVGEAEIDTRSPGERKCGSEREEGEEGVSECGSEGEEREEGGRECGSEGEEGMEGNVRVKRKKGIGRKRMWE